MKLKFTPKGKGDVVNYDLDKGELAALCLEKTGGGYCVSQTMAAMHMQSMLNVMGSFFDSKGQWEVIGE